MDFYFIRIIENNVITIRNADYCNTIASKFVIISMDATNILEY